MSLTVDGEPIKSELTSIQYAQGVFNIDQSYSAMCRALSCNFMSLVAGPAVEHNNVFHKNREALENKIIFVLDFIKKSI